MATPVEMADYGDTFITKLEQIAALAQQAFVIASNSEMLPDISGELQTIILQSRQTLGKAYNLTAVHIYRQRRAAG